MKKRPGKTTCAETEIVCLCNEVPRSDIEQAIRSGCDTLNKIYDRTQAGVGPCGGSCRKFIGPMLDCYLQSGEFPKGAIRKGPSRRK